LQEMRKVELVFLFRVAANRRGPQGEGKVEFWDWLERGFLGNVYLHPAQSDGIGGKKKRRNKVGRVQAPTNSVTIISKRGQ